MERCYVIADDLTGANAAAVLLKQEGMSPYVVFKQNNHSARMRKNVPALLFNTESRNMSPEAAGIAVEKIMKEIMESDKTPALIAKRIDSTLRGNIGGETDAVLGSLDSAYVAYMVPAFPEAGRTVLHGKMYVNQRPLEHSEAAQDPLKPVVCSEVKQIVEAQSHFKAGNIEISTIRGGTQSIQAAVEEKRRDGCRIIIFDGETGADLERIAEAVTGNENRFITVDPGPFTRQIVHARKKQGRILLLVGSVNPVTRLQVEKLREECQDAECVLVQTRYLIEEEAARKKEMVRAVAACLQAYKSKKAVLIAGDGIYPENRIDFSKPGFGENAEAFSQRITDGITEIAVRLLRKQKGINSLFLSGGDVAVSLLQKSKAEGFIPVAEVLPLAVCGCVAGGLLNGCRVITKGGMAGGEAAIVDCVRYLNNI